MSLLILMRHGESCWNQQNLFTGWVDIPLSSKGIQEALDAGKQISHLPIDVVFTSALARAQMSAFLALSEHQSGKIPVVQHPESTRLREWGTIYSQEALSNTIPLFYSWELNERMYGELQGLNKAETMRKFGDEQVRIWRRSYANAPPKGESLQDTATRTLPYFKKEILPFLLQGKNVFIPAHGNSLRAICMFLEQLTPEEVIHLEIPTGVPLIYRCEENMFTRVKD